MFLKLRGNFMNKLAYSVQELAEVLSIGKNAAYELCQRPDFPAIKVGERRIIVPVDGLKLWLETTSAVRL